MFLILRQAQDDISWGGCLMFLTLRKAQDHSNDEILFNVKSDDNYNNGIAIQLLSCQPELVEGGL